MIPLVLYIFLLFSSKTLQRVFKAVEETELKGVRSGFLACGTLVFCLQRSCFNITENTAFFPPRSNKWASLLIATNQPIFIPLNYLSLSVGNLGNPTWMCSVSKHSVGKLQWQDQALHSSGNTDQKPVLCDLVQADDQARSCPALCVSHSTLQGLEGVSGSLLRKLKQFPSQKQECHYAAMWKQESLEGSFQTSK